MSDPIANRLLGGSPLSVLLRLILVSLLVGAVMSWLDIDPAALFEWLERSLQRIWATGFRSVHQVGGYILTGAAVVLPIWLVLRLTSIGSREPKSTGVGRWDLPGASEAHGSNFKTERRD